MNPLERLAQRGRRLGHPRGDGGELDPRSLGVELLAELEVLAEVIEQRGQLGAGGGPEAERLAAERLRARAHRVERDEAVVRVREQPSNEAGGGRVRRGGRGRGGRERGPGEQRADQAAHERAVHLDVRVDREHDRVAGALEHLERVDEVADLAVRRGGVGVEPLHALGEPRAVRREDDLGERPRVVDRRGEVRELARAGRVDRAEQDHLRPGRGLGAHGAAAGEQHLGRGERGEAGGEERPGTEGSGHRITSWRVRKRAIQRISGEWKRRKSATSASAWRSPCRPSSRA